MGYSRVSFYHRWYYTLDIWGRFAVDIPWKQGTKWSPAFPRWTTWCIASYKQISTGSCREGTKPKWQWMRNQDLSLLISMLWLNLGRCWKKGLHSHWQLSQQQEAQDKLKPQIGRNLDHMPVFWAISSCWFLLRLFRAHSPQQVATRPNRYISWQMHLNPQIPRNVDQTLLMTINYWQNLS